MKVTIEITENESEWLRKYAIERGIKGALDAVNVDFEYYDEVQAVAKVYEGLRSKLVSAIFEEQRKIKHELFPIE